MSIRLLGTPFLQDVRFRVVDFICRGFIRNFCWRVVVRFLVGIKGSIVIYIWRIYLACMFGVYVYKYIRHSLLVVNCNHKTRRWSHKIDSFFIMTFYLQALVNPNIYTDFPYTKVLLYSLSKSYIQYINDNYFLSYRMCRVCRTLHQTSVLSLL